MSDLRIIIGGTGSGCGKTTVVCGVLSALAKRGMKVLSYKVGPDYIDPMFHKKVTGVSSSNLDVFLTGENGVKNIIAKNSEKFDISVIEGVMGFYDGAVGSFASSCHIGNLTNTPSILVVNPKGMGISLAALVGGFLNFEKNGIKAVILNNVSEKMISYYKKIIEENCAIKVLGGLPFCSENSVESRHLGLVTANEILNLKNKIENLAKLCEKYIDIDELINIAKGASDFEYEKIEIGKVCENVKIAVAKDDAFCFYYEENLEILEKMGAEIEFFSPLEDFELPCDCNGVYIGGGYPELYLRELSQNKKIISDIKKRVLNNMPVFAECGGFMYLHSSICNNEEEYPMVGIIEGKAELTKNLVDFGYVSLTAEKDNVMCKKGESINAHEFHYSKSSDKGDCFLAKKISNGNERTTIHTFGNVFCGYPHLHFYGNLDFAKRFLLKCKDWKEALK